MRAIICYDFSEDKARSRFCKVLAKYGFRIQYSVFEFHLDKDTWKKFVTELQKKKFLDGNHNIVIIPITESIHKKMLKLGSLFMAFDFSTLVYSGLGIKGIGEKNATKIELDKLADL